MIRSLDRRDKTACVEVAATLPEWFGYPNALEGIGEAAATKEGFVAVDDGAVVGFALVQHDFEETLELLYLAVRKDRRGQGFGSSLVAAVAHLAAETGASTVCLLTLGPEADSPFYEETVAFYRSIGFARVKELHIAEWNGAPSLVMAASPDALLSAAREGEPRPRRAG